MVSKPAPLHGWRCREDGVVVGVFGHHDTAFLRRELTLLRPDHVVRSTGVCGRLG